MIAEGRVKLPPYPGVAARLTRLVSSDDFGLKEVAQLVSSDQALAADLMRVANFSLYGGMQKVTAVSAAINRLGADQVVRVALASGLGSSARKAGTLDQLRFLTWRRALVSALFCQNLGARRKLKAGECFTCGLLHDFGEVVAISCIEELLCAREEGAKPRRALERSDEHDCAREEGAKPRRARERSDEHDCAREEGAKPRRALERSAPELQSQPLDHWASVVERHHVTLGLSLAQEWGLAEAVQEVIETHHWPDAAVNHRALVELVVISDQVLALMEDHAEVTEDDLESVDGLSKPERDFVARLLPKIPDVVASFGGPAAPSEQSAVRPPETTLVGQRRPLDTTVTIQQEDRSLPCRARSITTDGMELTSPDPLAPQNLVRVAVETPDGQVELWANVTLCEKEGAGHRLEVKPYGVGSQSRCAWDELFRKAQE
jgi:HD-like signal output (HDOD) protein